jgi:hypothetical protein
MNEQRMTVEEIREHYPNEWVLLDAPEFGEGQQVVSGCLLYHNHDREVFDQKTLELRTSRAAIFYTGKFPKGVAILL